MIYQYANKEIYMDLIREAVADEAGEGIDNARLYISQRLYSEMGWRLDRGESTVMVLIDWLQGLAIDIPFTYYDIIVIANEGGIDREPACLEANEDPICDEYWTYMAYLIRYNFLLSRQCAESQPRVGA